MAMNRPVIILISLALFALNGLVALLSIFTHPPADGIVASMLIRGVITPALALLLVWGLYQRKVSIRNLALGYIMFYTAIESLQIVFPLQDAINGLIEIESYYQHLAIYGAIFIFLNGWWYQLWTSKRSLEYFGLPEQAVSSKNKLVVIAVYLLALIAIPIFTFTEDDRLEQAETVLEAEQTQQAQEPSEKFYGLISNVDQNPAKTYHVLPLGEGSINGKILRNGTPLRGLELRLFVNGNSSTQWAVSDEEGVYTISLPDGEYQIDGYELEKGGANFLLDKLVGPFLLEEENASGPSFSFVTPIKKIPNFRAFYLGSASANEMHSWQAYPEASYYKLVFFELISPTEFSIKPNEVTGEKAIVSFEINTEGLGFVPADFNEGEFREGFYYSYQISAFSKEGKLISKSAPDPLGYDIQILKSE